MSKLELTIQITKIVLMVIMIGIGIYFFATFGDRVSESQPLYSPLEGYGASSPSGQWIFTKEGWKINK